MDYPSETSLAVYSRHLPHRHPFSDFFSGEGAAVHRLSETDNPSSNCPSKMTDKVRRRITRLTRRSVSKTAISVLNECRAPALSWAFACLLLLFHKDYF